MFVSSVPVYIYLTVTASLFAVVIAGRIISEVRYKKGCAKAYKAGFIAGKATVADGYNEYRSGAIKECNEKHEIAIKVATQDAYYFGYTTGIKAAVNHLQTLVDSAQEVSCEYTAT